MLQTRRPALFSITKFERCVFMQVWTLMQAFMAFTCTVGGDLAQNGRMKLKSDERRTH